MNKADLATLTADIVAAHMANNIVPIAQVEDLITNVGDALASLSGTSQTTSSAEEEVITPKVPIRASIMPDHLVCLECGERKRMLSRHLERAHDLTPMQYRERFGLKKDYPMAAPETAAALRKSAIDRGLGNRSRQDKGVLRPRARTSSK